MAEAHVTSDARFAIVPEGIILDGTSAQALHLYCALARHGTDPANCYPSHARLAAQIGCSTDTVGRRLDDLVQRGWITVTPRHRDDGGRTSNGYHLHTHPAPPAPLREAPPAPLREAPPAPLREERESVERESVERSPHTPHGQLA